LRLAAARCEPQQSSIEIHHRRPAHQNEKPAWTDEGQLTLAQKSLVFCGYTHGYTRKDKDKDKDGIRPR